MTLLHLSSHQPEGLQDSLTFLTFATFDGWDTRMVYISMVKTHHYQTLVISFLPFSPLLPRLHHRLNQIDSTTSSADVETTLEHSFPSPCLHPVKIRCRKASSISPSSLFRVHALVLFYHYQLTLNPQLFFCNIISSTPVTSTGGPRGLAQVI